MEGKKSAILSFSRKKWLGDIALRIDNRHNSTWRIKAIENFLSSIVYYCHFSFQVRKCQYPCLRNETRAMPSLGLQQHLDGYFESYVYSGSKLRRVFDPYSYPDISLNQY